VAKKKLSKKNTSDRSDHLKSLGDVAKPLADEVNTTMRTVICVLLVLVTFAIYSQVKDHEFIGFDDPMYVTENLNVQAGLTSESISWAFTTFAMGSWSPLTWFSHMLDYQLYGLHAKGHHLTSLFFHIANSLLLFLVLFRMTGTIWQSAFVAAIFAFHPLNVESVAWVAERKNVLSTLFWLMTMWAYIHYVQKPSIKRYSLVIAFFILGLMSKAMLVTLPFVLLLLDFWPLRRLKFSKERGRNEVFKKNIVKKSEVSKLVFEKTPLFLLTIGLCIITFIAQKRTGAMNDAENYTFSTRVTNAMVSYLEYLEKMVWPRGLSILYPHPGNTLAEWKGILCGIALVGISIISIRLIRKAPYFLIGWLWYLGTLVPVIGIVQVGRQAMADRYAYIPLIGIFIIVAWGVPELLSKWRFKKKVLSVSAGIIIFALLKITWEQVGHWKNSITIFKHAIKVTDIKYPSFYDAYNNLGSALLIEQKIEEAISNYKIAIKINPDSAEPHYNLGVALVAEGENEEAISHYKISVKINPDFAEAYNNLGTVLFAKGKNEEAISHYNIAIKTKPDFAEAYNNLGSALLREKKNKEAISNYKIAIKINPDSAEPHYNLGVALVAEGGNEEAISHYKIAIKINPDSSDAHYNLGKALVAEGMNEEAISHYKMAIKVKSDYVNAYINLSAAYLRNNNFKLALKTLNTLESINPNDPLLHYNFSCYYALLGNISKSIDSLKKAIANGFKNHQLLETDPDLANLHQNPQFNELLSSLLAKNP
jgi:tetratricopeptide (TPR) repeat protein